MLYTSLIVHNTLHSSLEYCSSLDLSCVSITAFNIRCLVAGCHNVTDYIAFIYDYLTCELQLKLYEQHKKSVRRCWKHQHPRM